MQTRALQLPLPLSRINRIPLGRAVRMRDDMIKRIAEAGWPWCREESLCEDAVQARLDRETEAARPGRWRQ